MVFLWFSRVFLRFSSKEAVSFEGTDWKTGYLKLLLLIALLGGF